MSGKRVKELRKVEFCKNRSLAAAKIMALKIHCQNNENDLVSLYHLSRLIERAKEEINVSL